VFVNAIAWLLNFGDGELAAVGQRELLHLVPQSSTFEVPRGPRHCRQVLAWQNQLVPVWDILEWLRPGRGEKQAALAAVVGYQSRRRQVPRFGVLMLVEPPRRIEVSNSQACELGKTQSAWRGIAISSFRHEGTSMPVPVLDLPLMFSTELAQGDALREASA
jgi:hypothetical protein